MRSTRRSILGCGFALLAALLLGVAPVGATPIHQKVGSFTGFDAPGGAFGALLTGDAIDQTNGDIYVTESSAFGGQNVVDKFNGAGEYAGVQLTGPKIAGQETFAFGFFPGVAVDNSAGSNKGDVYVTDSGHQAVERFSSAGAFLCEITGRTPASKEEEEHECHGAAGSLTPDGSIEPSGIAVDAAGVVYVADDAHAVVDKFSETGAYLGQIKDSHITNEVGTIALDATGNLYLTNLNFFGGNPDNVIKFDAAGAFVSVLDGHGPFGVGVDPSTGDVFVHETGESHEQLAEYDASGVQLDVTPTPGAPALGVAVNGTTGEIYEAGLGTGSVSIYSGHIAVPTVTVLPATNVTETSATLNGHVDRDAAHQGGEITSCEFEWGETTFYGHTAPCAPAAPYATASNVMVPITGLKRGGVYHYRVKAANATGTSESADETLTVAAQPAIDRQSSRVSGVSAVVTAQINPLHLDTTCHLQYVDDGRFKASGYSAATTLPCAPEDLGSGLGDVPANVALTGLNVGTTYHYRFLASNVAGLAGGPDRTFVTFGVHGASFELVDDEGNPFTQAGGHPYELRTGFEVNWTENVGGVPFLNQTAHPGELPTGNIQTVLTDLPPGLIGNPSATTKCTRVEVIKFGCGPSAQVGVFEAEEAAGGALGGRDGVYNLVPPKGVVAEFGASILSHLTVYIDARLRPDGDYAITAEAQNNSALAGITKVALHLWGVPADPRHDKERCAQQGGDPEHGFFCKAPVPAGAAEIPLLLNPTSCGGAMTTVLSVDSYQATGLFDKHLIEAPPTIGCSELDFSPTLQASPTSNVADSPTGLHVDLHIPQQPSIEDPASRREADLEDTVVTLPGGLTINPAAAGGLEACSSRQIGLSSAVGTSPATFDEAPPRCPGASKVGTVEVDTPLLSEEDEEGRVVEEGGLPVPHVLHGAVYIASPYDNPFDSLFAIYIVVEDPRTGIVIKLAGHVEPDAETGQLKTTFTKSPQVPFEDFKLDFFSGPRATLATPESCGTYAASTSLTPWNGGPAATPVVPAFGISRGCVTGFTPAFTAGTLSPQAGAFSPLTLSFQRSDSDQELSGLTVSLPPGLLAKVAGVEKCSDAALAAAAAKSGGEEQAGPSCPSGSLLGTVQAGAGAGETPYFTSGKAYLTGPYKGGPYGVAVIVPAVAGPFDLGNVVVRTALHIDPTDGHVTAVSDPFPTILKGVPLRVRRVTLTMDRPQFTFNPTSCNPMSFTGALTSTGGLVAPLSQRFQAAGCQNLPFKPSFTATTQGNGGFHGASLDVKVKQSPGEAAIRKVDTQLPLALPSRLTTLQKACTEGQFATNPAGCPPGSRVGTATAITPVLNVPLTGPAYLVSHGGAAFPDLDIILQGEGVTIDLVGNTDIKKGITYSRFETVPDAPISSFELNLPGGPGAVLAATKNLCASTTAVTVSKKVTRRVHGHIKHVTVKVKRAVPAPLLMPTTLTGQDGAISKQITKIAVTGCAKPGPKAKKRATAKKKHKRR